MAVSANTLFHFTTKEGLKGILSSLGFYYQYSTEHFENILPHKSHYRFTYIPMISFCDLTIMQLSTDPEHRKNFGDFGIGLKKSWGTAKGISPVMYVHKQSQQTKRLNRIFNTVNNFHKKKNNDEVIDGVEQEMIDSFKYIKPYKGYWQKKTRRRKIVNYYNEREWRFAPLLNEHAVLSGIIKENKKEVVEINDELKKKIIKFEVDQVKYIVIKRKKDIQFISDVIRSIPEIKENQINELITKIISFEEIREDFG